MRKLLPIVLVLFASMGCETPELIQEAESDFVEGEATDAQTVPDFVEGEANQIAELRKKAEAGDADAQNNLGFMYSEGQGVLKDDKEAVKWYRKAAEQGDAKAQYNLGFAYAFKDDKEAVKWWRKAAEQGYADAQLILGQIYDHGGDGLKDDKEAVKWYRKAAEQEDEFAQLSLGYAYYIGRGVLKDYVAAYAWFNLAAYNGNKGGAKIREMVAKEMTPEQIAEAQEMSKLLLKKIAANKAANK